MFISDLHVCLDAFKHGRALHLLGTLWETQEVRVFFMDGSFELQQRIWKAARQWSDLTGVRFIPARSRGESDVRITFSSGGSWSFIGTQAKSVPYNKATMQLGWITEDTELGELEQVVLHEFGHVMGLMHEHQNPSGGVQWDYERVMSYYTGYPNYWNRTEVQENVFQKYRDDQILSTTFDPESIMLYPIPAAFTTNGFEVGWNGKLSAQDIEFIQRLYTR